MKIHTYNWLRLRAASLVAIAMTACCCTGNAQSGSAEATAEQEPEYHQVRLIFGGDLMQHEPQIKAARQADGTYDYSGVFDYMAPIVKDADIAIQSYNDLQIEAVENLFRERKNLI